MGVPRMVRTSSRTNRRLVWPLELMCSIFQTTATVHPDMKCRFFDVFLGGEHQMGLPADLFSHRGCVVVSESHSGEIFDREIKELPVNASGTFGAPPDELAGSWEGTSARGATWTGQRGRFQPSGRGQSFERVFVHPLLPDFDVRGFCFPRASVTVTSSMRWAVETRAVRSILANQASPTGSAHVGSVPINNSMVMNKFITAVVAPFQVAILKSRNSSPNKKSPRHCVSSVFAVSGSVKMMWICSG